MTLLCELPSELLEAICFGNNIPFYKIKIIMGDNKIFMNRVTMIENEIKQTIELFYIGENIACKANKSLIDHVVWGDTGRGVAMFKINHNYKYYKYFNSFTLSLYFSEVSLNLGTSPNTKRLTNSNNSKIIIEAIECGDWEHVKLLIEYGVDTSITDYEGNTLLHKCVDPHYYSEYEFYKMVDIVKLLVESNADTEKMNHHGHTPLMILSSAHKLGEITTNLFNKVAYYLFNDDPRNYRPLPIN